MTVEERWGQRHADSSGDFEYLIRGPLTRDGVLAELLAALPVSVGSLTLQRISSIEEVRGALGVWLARVSYGFFREKHELSSGDSEFYFSNGSRTFTRTISRSSKVYDSAGLMSPQPSDARVIGWNPSSRTADGVEDEETLNAFGWNIVVPFTTATVSWRKQAGELRGSTNASAFFGYAAGEVLMQDMQSTVRADGEFRISMNFLQFPNETNLDIGGITVTEKQGWDIVDARDQEWVEEGTPPRLVPKVSRVSIHTIKASKDWSLLADLLGAALDA